MTLATLLQSNFPTTVRERGERYFWQKRVTIVLAERNGVTAQVRGTARYRVHVNVDEFGPLFGVDCDCPYFEDNGPCKHIWATLLEIDARHLLTVPDAPGEDEGDDAWEFADDDETEEDDEESYDNWDDEAVGLPWGPVRGPATGLRPLDWQSAMRVVRTAFDRRAAPAPPPPETQYRYLIDRDATLRTGSLVLVVMETRPRKNGGWTKLKPVRRRPGASERIADPDDRRFLTLLEGGRSWHEGYGPTSNGLYQLTATLAEVLLPSLAECKRLYLDEDGALPEEARPLAMDAGEPWRFCLHVQRDDTGRDYAVTGKLVRGEESMPLAQPRLLVNDGWLFLEDRLARFDPGGAFAWITILRRQPTLTVPAQEADGWLGELLTSPDLPPVTLPDELRVERVALTPTPRLRLFPARRDTDGNHFGAIVEFDYAGQPVPARSPAACAFDPARRRVCERDFDFEQAAVESLKALRFREARPYYQSAYPEACDVEIPTKHFVDAVAALLPRGWLIEAEGKPYRNAGAVSLSVSSGIDWFDLNGTVDFGGTAVPLPTLLKALNKGATTIVLDDGSIGMLPAEWRQRYGGLGALGQLKDDAVRFSRAQVSLLDALLAAEPEAHGDAAFRRLRDELHTFTAVAAADAPPTFQGTLREYQREGLGWLAFLQRFGFGGCLADDMGLGKTVQVLAFLEARRAASNGNAADPNGHGPTLVVVPRSLIFNWKQEAARFTPALRVLDHSGSGRDGTGDAFHAHDLILTTYGTLRRDILMLREIPFDYVILDEAQAIKNAATATAKAARLLRTRQRLALSGTPIENHLGELWSLFEFLNPGMLGSASAFQLGLGADRENNTAHLQWLARALRPFVLRRTKAQVVKELPEKLEETLYCELLPAQRKQYDELRDHYRQALAGAIEAKGLARSKIMVLEALLRLRQAACHPALLDSSKHRQSSAKLDVLMGQIQDVVDEDHKILVFSQFTSLLAIVRRHLDKAGVAYAYLDGQTRKRDEAVERFQTDPACRVFLISIKAGGLGLNLTAADYVVLLDPWWNPAVEAQAIDRSHRIGQTRRVFAYRIVARDTVEERILELQQKKRALADSIINADNSLIRSLTREDLALLLA